ncbi:hypothetical protein VTN00DRAFT_1826 [Thermoascus crustaceus]|uniref:uncharacterized protein n=1 Tax=Thermoascus crustaceus TaxID=5088 RepID=UPI003744772B
MANRETKPRVGGPEVSTRDLFRLDGRTVLITGGTGALGLEVAGSVLESGGDVICIDLPELPPEAGWTKVQAIAETHGTRATYYSCDVTDADRLRFLFEETMPKTRYPLRGVVTCAGVSGRVPAVDYPVDDFRRIVDINLVGTFIVAQAAAREMRNQNVSGSIVLVASMSGWGSNKGLDTSAYNSSKSAVLQLGRSLAAEWGSRQGHPSIRVNTISPGYIKTRLTAESLAKPTQEQVWSAENMLNRISTTDEYRAPIIFLLADGSSFMTGADLRIDGGHRSCESMNELHSESYGLVKNVPISKHWKWKRSTIARSDMPRSAEYLDL